MTLLAPGLSLLLDGGELELLLERLLQLFRRLFVLGALAGAVVRGHGVTPVLTPSPVAMLMVVDVSLLRRWPSRITNGRVKK